MGDCFIYNNSAWRLNYSIGGEVTTLYHLDRPMYLLGYLASQSRVYLIDKQFNVVGYKVLLALIEFKTLILREDIEAATQILPDIPKVCSCLPLSGLFLEQIRAECILLVPVVQCRPLDLQVTIPGPLLWFVHEWMCTASMVLNLQNLFCLLAGF